jgi:hypothetical protein
VSLLKKFPNAKVCHLYGHQDKRVVYENLDIPTQLNVDCDLGAKQCMRESEIDTTRPVPVAGSRAVFFLGGEMVTSNIKEQIQYANQAPAMAQYIKDKFVWTDNQYNSVNWKANGIGMKRRPLRQAIRTSKMYYNLLSLGCQKQKLGSDPMCPCYGRREEDFLHLMQCK